MTSKERVLKAFSHKTPDQVPVDYAAEPELDSLLINHLKLSNRDALLRRLNVDFKHLDKGGTIVPKYVGPELPPEQNGITEDIWGCRLKKLEYRPGCFYYEYVDPPLVNATTVQDVDKHRWPQPEWYDFSDVGAYCRENKEYALVAGLGATLDSVGFFRGMEKAMFDIYDNPKLLEAIIEKLFEFKYEYNRYFLEAADGNLDILFISEDMGGQESLLVSRETLKKYVYPVFQKFAELGHKHNALVMLHSDGAIREIIPDLIDLGIDILNPVQITLPGMDAAGLKKDFGGEICFHGLLDGQDLMPFAAPKIITKELNRIIDVMGIDGGLAIAPSNNLQIDVPPENILAAYDMPRS